MIRRTKISAVRASGMRRSFEDGAYNFFVPHATLIIQGRRLIGGGAYSSKYRSSWAELDQTLLLKIGYVILETVSISSFIFILIKTIMCFYRASCGTAQVSLEQC